MLGRPRHERGQPEHEARRSGGGLGPACLVRNVTSEVEKAEGEKVS